MSWLTGINSNLMMVAAGSRLLPRLVEWIRQRFHVRETVLILSKFDKSEIDVRSKL